MSIVTRIQYAAMVGQSAGYINVNIQRGNIMSIIGGDDNKKIDTDNVINKRFAKNQRKLKKAKKAKEEIYKNVVEVVEVSDSKKPNSKETTATRKAKAEQRKKAEQMQEFEFRKKKAEAVKFESDAELKLLAVEKMMGKLMPVELVHQIIKINIQSVFVGFEQELINIASIYCDILAGGDRSKLSEVMNEMRENLSRIIKDVETNSKTEIKQVIENYSETRSRGEKK